MLRFSPEREPVTGRGAQACEDQWMSSPLIRAAVLTGVGIAVINILFAGTRYGFATLPVWFYAVQLLLLPAMVYTLRIFGQALRTRPYVQRAALYALGWAPPYLIYSLSGELLRPGVNVGAAVVSAIVFLLIFAAVFAAIRKPQ